MTICIIHESGTFWTNDFNGEGQTVNDAVNAIESGASVRVWWFVAHGQRYSEDMWFDPEHLIAVRTESDD